ncbi:MAG: phage tail protein [Culturomica sp.]|jgi:phage protein U|nr:phage tail protein [Culturomica sp.]
MELTALDGVSAFEETAGYTFSEQAIATGKPVLQAMGETLSEVTLSITLRKQLGHDVTDFLSRINTLRKSGKPQRLVFGSGTYQGDYVITGITTSVIKTSATGEIVAADLQLSLKEHADRVVIAQKNVESRPSGEASNRKVTEK